MARHVETKLSNKFACLVFNEWRVVKSLLLLFVAYTQWTMPTLGECKTCYMQWVCRGSAATVKYPSPS